MSKQTVGVLVPSDMDMPSMTVEVNGYESITQFVGGMIDAVRTDISADAIGADNTSGDGSFTAVGYVHDEGLLIGLPFNARASMIFGRQLVGDVLIVSGTSDAGVYDGDNYDVPEWFIDRISDGSLEKVVTMGKGVAHMVGDAIEYCVRVGLFTEPEVDFVLQKMDEVASGGGSELDAEMVQLFMLECTKQYAMHKLGVDEGMLKMVYETDMNGISDEELEKFLEEEGK